MYRNGFIVDDGPFRDISAPENQAFVKALEAGNVPAGKRSVPMSISLFHLLPIISFTHIIYLFSVSEMSQGLSGDIEVSLNDKRAEDYVPPPPPSYVAFSNGTTLGSSSGSSSGEKVMIKVMNDK
jgi:hypothetical protein